MASQKDHQKPRAFFTIVQMHPKTQVGRPPQLIIAGFLVRDYLLRLKRKFQLPVELIYLTLQNHFRNSLSTSGTVLAKGHRTTPSSLADAFLGSIHAYLQELENVIQQKDAEIAGYAQQLADAHGEIEELRASTQTTQGDFGACSYQLIKAEREMEEL
jgi:hypothetical protein